MTRRKPRERLSHRLWIAVPDSTYKQLRWFADENGITVPQAARAYITRQARYVDRQRVRKDAYFSDAYLFGLAEKIVKQHPEFYRTTVVAQVVKSLGRGYQDPERIMAAVDAAWSSSHPAKEK